MSIYLPVAVAAIIYSLVMWAIVYGGTHEDAPTPPLKPKLWKGNMKNNNGFSLVELLVVVAIIGIITAIAIPGLLKARQAGNEASAIGSLRAINSGEATYAASCGFGGYATSLADLGKPPQVGGTGFISPDLIPGRKSGYTVSLEVSGRAGGNGVITMAVNTCNASADALAGYFAGAIPDSVGSTGQRAFGTDDRGTIFQDITGVALANPIPPAAVFIQ